MRGRGSTEVSDDIEILDAEPAPARSLDLVETGSNNRWAAVAASALAVSAGLFVVGVGNSPAPLQPPEVTIDEAPAEAEQPLTEREQLEEQYGVAIGDGPELNWQLADTTTATRSWQWAGDRFASDNGTTERSLRLVDGEVMMSDRPSSAIEYPGYRLSTINGGQLLIPAESTPDHMVVLRGDSTIRIPLSKSDWPTSDLFVTNAWADGEVLGDRLVVQVANWTSVNIDELRTRTGEDLPGIVWARVVNGEIQIYPPVAGSLPEPISFEDAGLTVGEIADAELLNSETTEVLSIDLRTLDVVPIDLVELQYTDMFVLSPTGDLIINWTDNDELRWDSTTTDGLTWTTTRSSNYRWLVSSGTQLFDRSPSSSIGRSTNGGDFWVETATPLRDRERTFAGDVIALGRPWNNIGINTGVIVDTGTDDFGLNLFDQGQRFELRGIREFEPPLLEGWIEDPMSGAAWDWQTNELVFTDPTSDEELVRVSEHAVFVASAEAKPMETIALAHWPAEVRDPEWFVASPLDVFGHGTLSVDFVGGGQQLLAIVTTASGFDVYVADTAQQS